MHFVKLCELNEMFNNNSHLALFSQNNLSHTEASKLLLLRYSEWKFTAIIRSLLRKDGLERCINELSSWSACRRWGHHMVPKILMRKSPQYRALKFSSNTASCIPSTHQGKEKKMFMYGMTIALLTFRILFSYRSTFRP